MGIRLCGIVLCSVGLGYFLTEAPGINSFQILDLGAGHLLVMGGVLLYFLGGKK